MIVVATETKEVKKIGTIVAGSLCYWAQFKCNKRIHEAICFWFFGCRFSADPLRTSPSALGS